MTESTYNKVSPPVEIRHRIISFKLLDEQNPLTVTHAKCACEKKGTINEIQSHIKQTSQKSSE